MISFDPLPMAEAQAFWRDKVQMGPGAFSKLSAEAKVKAFAVSGIAKGDELATVFTAMQKAIDQGTTLAEFKKDCAEIFERRGWTGKRAWRIDNIFRTNIQTAYNIGHYRQLREAGDLFPFWQYSAVNDGRTRPTHRAMGGRVWPADHPIWNIWFPPNGYRCRCSVIGITRRQAERRGVTVETDDPTNGLIEPIDPVTGNRMPARQLIPDPGFAHNPGKVWLEGLGEVYADRIMAWPEALRRPALQDLLDGPVFAYWRTQPEGAFPIAVIGPEAGRGRTISTLVQLPPQTEALLRDLSPQRLSELAEAAAGQGEVMIEVGGAAVLLRVESREGKTVLVASRTEKA